MARPNVRRAHILQPRTAVTIAPALIEPAAGIASFVEREHRRLDGLLARTKADVAAGRIEAARTTFEDFRAGLAAHVAIEEELLFPLFEACVGIIGGPTQTLRQEHREIERAARLMADALEHADAGAFREALRFLEGVRSQHDSKEEHVLYPTTDRMLSERELAAVEERLARRSSKAV